MILEEPINTNQKGPYQIARLLGRVYDTNHFTYEFLNILGDITSYRRLDDINDLSVTARCFYNGKLEK